MFRPPLGVNFINILCTDFTCADPKRIRTQSSRQYHFMLLGSARVKAVQKNVDKIDTRSRSYELEILLQLLFSSQSCVATCHLHKRISKINKLLWKLRPTVQSAWVNSKCKRAMRKEKRKKFDQFSQHDKFLLSERRQPDNVATNEGYMWGHCARTISFNAHFKMWK